MSKDDKAGSAVLLDESHFEMENPWGKPVVGWTENSQGLRGFHNPRGYAAVWITLRKLIDGTMKHLYEQPMIVENVGSIVIAMLGDRVGLAQNFRMVGDRLLPDAGTEYIKQLEEKKLWGKLVESLGRWCWEAPRGLAPPMGEGEDLENFILRTAKLEALEEAGFVINDAKIAGTVNTNPTFTPHAQYVVLARISSLTDAKPENLEIIGNRRFFTMEELRELNKKGEFDDGLTLAALAICGFSL